MVSMHAMRTDKIAWWSKIHGMYWWREEWRERGGLHWKMTN